jgi:hypothetical protein
MSSTTRNFADAVPKRKIGAEDAKIKSAGKSAETGGNPNYM